MSLALTRGDEISKIVSMEKLLLHSCCGPCSTVCIERLKENFDLTIFYFNPNIEPKEEYEKRKDEQKKVCKFFGIPFVDCDYDNEGWHKSVKGFENQPEGGARCEKCFAFRLERTAEYAKENDFDLFSTTLTVSPYKKTEMINTVGKEISRLTGVKFLEESFKKKDGYLRSVALAKELDLYRQHYCGCMFAKIIQDKQFAEKQRKID